MAKYEALAVIGDRAHPAAYIQEGLSRAFQAVGVPYELTQDVEQLSAARLKDVQLFVLFRIGIYWEKDLVGGGRKKRPGPRVPLTQEYVQEIWRLVRETAGLRVEDYIMPDGLWMTRDQESALQDFVTRGGGFLALHDANAFYPKDGPFRKLVGGHFVHHPPLHTFTVQAVSHGHPLMEGVSDYQITDEQYFMDCDPGGVTMLAKSVSREGESPSVWCREHGQGRVSFIANGHGLEAFLHPHVQRLTQNAIRWCLKMPV